MTVPQPMVQFVVKKATYDELVAVTVEELRDRTQEFIETALNESPEFREQIGIMWAAKLGRQLEAERQAEKVKRDAERQRQADLRDAIREAMAVNRRAGSPMPAKKPVLTIAPPIKTSGDAPSTKTPNLAPVKAAPITVKEEAPKPMSEAEKQKAEERASLHKKKVERLMNALLENGFDRDAADRIVRNCLKKHNGDLLQAALGKRENAELTRTAGTNANDASVIAKADEELALAYRYANAVGISKEEFDAKYGARVQRKLTERLNTSAKPAEQKKPPFKKGGKNKKK